MYAIVFPGQGAQAVGMAADFAERFPAARQVLDEADEAFGDTLSRWMAEGPAETLRRTEVTQPAILAASIAILAVLEERLPAPPVLLAGHSLGEYSALVAAGALTLGDAVRVVRQRGAFMQQAVPEGEGAMAAVMGIGGDEVRAVCDRIADGVVAPANYNSSAQTVIAGDAAAVERATAALKEAGAKKVVALDVSAPFHCALMGPAQERLAGVLADTAFADLRIPVVSNVTAEPYRSAPDARELLRQQVTAPVRWVEVVQRLMSEGASLLLEVGPGKVLSGLTARIDRQLGRANVATVEDVDGAIEAVEKAAKESA